MLAVQKLLLVTALSLGYMLAAVPAGAQVPTEVDEKFDINIVHDTVTETNFARSTDIRVDSGSLSVKAGVAVSAERIVLTIKGATGQVTFRASLRSTDEIFRKRRPR